MLLKQFADFIMILLILATIASFADEEWKAAVTLLIVIIFNALVGWIQEMKAEAALSALMRMDLQLGSQITWYSYVSAVAIRDGLAQNVPAEQLVPGDLVQLDEGAQGY